MIIKTLFTVDTTSNEYYGMWCPMTNCSIKPFTVVFEHEQIKNQLNYIQITGDKIELIV